MKLTENKSFLLRYLQLRWFSKNECFSEFRRYLLKFNILVQMLYKNLDHLLNALYLKTIEHIIERGKVRFNDVG